jgi:hypothetical protein
MSLTQSDGLERVRVFTMADEHYFLGLVALVNSLRLQGCEAPLTVLDLGLTPRQREIIGAECELLSRPEVAGLHPWLLQPYVCTLRPADIVVYVDADIIMTQPLDEIVDSARRGRLCVFRDINATRWCTEWQSIFGLPGSPRHQTYVNAGFIVFSTKHFPTLLARWNECCQSLVGSPTFVETNSLASPTALTSQDALNALLMSEVAAGAVDCRTASAQGPAELIRTRIADLARVQCLLDGQRMTLLHSWGPLKPWRDRASRSLRRTAYVRCLRRLLTQTDVGVQLPAAMAPRWLRPGARGAATLWGLDYRTGLIRQGRRLVRTIRNLGSTEDRLHR